jgi:hypothetical protein
MFDAQLLSDIANSLKASSAGQDIAVAEDAQSPGAIYYAKRAPRVKEPYSAVVKLIQIGKNKKWKFHKGMVSTALPTEMCLGKRVGFVEMINPEKGKRLRALLERIVW